MELGPSPSSDVNKSGMESSTKSLFKHHTEEDGFFTRCRYKLSRKRQHLQPYRIIKPRNQLWPGISNNNKIINTKYNILTFLPCFFYDQFKYFFNFYYLCLCLSQFYPPLKIGFLFTYIGPLAFVLFLSMFNLAVDELSKYLRDLEVNSERFRVTLFGREEEKKSGDLEVGDVVVLKEGDRAPADLLILATGDPLNRCWVRTDQIDGETDLKLRKPCPVICDLLKGSGSFLESIDVEFVIPTPNQLIYKFEGAAHILLADSIQKKISLDYENTLWGGCKIGKSSVLGLVIYNGEDSKMMMSAEEIEPKRSMLVDELNDLSKLLFFIMVILSLTIVMLKGNQTNLFLQIFRYVLLLSTIIPISVKVNHDLSRLYYSSRINNDKDMPGCQARNSSVCEDLGRIKYILSDKTGTLTKNEMEMRKVYIDKLGELTTNQYRNELGKATSKNPGGGSLLEFNHCMMVCHSVTPTVDENQERVLESASPDELSFLTLMEESGFMLADKTDQSVIFNDQVGVIHRYKIEATFPFSSERKRMGVICSKEGQQDLVFYLKGADSIMKPKLSPRSVDTAMKNAEKLSSEGLRTLVLGRRAISRSEYEEWRRDYDEASAALNNRNIKVEASIERIEKNLDFIGITAVEDLLQDNVKDCIVLLRKAGIKVWMLTGDKMETAHCISISTGLLSSSDKVWQIERILNGAELKSIMKSFKQSAVPDQSYFLLIDGISLTEATKPDNIEDFLSLAMQASCVCCCRCAPSQKREITSKLKQLGERVLGIGDGGNDVGMIQEAHVGVGIAGKEGKQAALASDYSITEFQQVAKLVLWHGRNIYNTCSKMCFFVMHRGLIIATIQFYFTVTFYFVDLPIFNGFLTFGYSTFFTNLPVIAIIMDEDIDFPTMRKYPILYREPQRGLKMSLKRFFIMLAESVFQGAVIMLMTLALFPSITVDIVTIVFSALIVTELLNTLTMVSRVSITLIFTVGVSILAYYVTISFLSEQVNVKLIDTEFAKKIGIIVACSWLTVYVMHKFKNCCFPPYQDKVLRGEISHKDDILGQTYNPRMTARTFGDLVDHTHAPTGGSRYGDQPAVPTEVEPLL